MYKVVFQNSKAAFAFAAMTLFGAVTMVGTPEDSGVVVKAADVLSSERSKAVDTAQAHSQGQSEGESLTNAGSGSGPGKATPVFGPYNGDIAPAPQAVSPDANTVPAEGQLLSDREFMAGPE